MSGSKLVERNKVIDHNKVIDEFPELLWSKTRSHK